MLGAVLAYLNNWFERDPVTRMRNVYAGRLAVSGRTLTGLPDGFLADGQHVRIRGSRLNDGVYAWPCFGLSDEEFAGEAWALSVPADVLALAEDVAEWVKRYGDAQDSPYASESFGGYSYTKASGDGPQGGSTWQAAFAARLAPWRKL